jgi:hypothetical protein
MPPSWRVSSPDILNHNLSQEMSGGDQKRKMKVIDRIKKNIAKLEFKPGDVGFVIT